MARGSEGNRSISAKLLRWYRQNRRALPWRGRRDPYFIWLSEAMLQQTQVATVVPYYERFLERFPTIERLAAAPLDDVLRLWAGLGYYARARNLHAAARRIVADHGGKLPDTVEELRKLPGFGPYTAGAVASIAFGRRAAVVDGNVARVLARLHAIRSDVRAPATRSRLWRLAESLLPRRSCGDFNQAMMELGATLCTPAIPRCGRCPLRTECRAFRLGAADRLPVVAARPRVRRETHVVAAITRAGRWLFVRRPRRGLWGGLWELPTAPSRSTASLAVARRLAGELCGAGVAVEARPFCRIERQLSHRKITFAGHVCRTATTLVHSASGGRVWRSLDDLADLGISRAMSEVIDALRLRTAGGPSDGGRRAATA
jgi:A/G-specific adenine glycosylase